MLPSRQFFGACAKEGIVDSIYFFPPSPALQRQNGKLFDAWALLLFPELWRVRVFSPPFLRYRAALGRILPVPFSTLSKKERSISGLP